MRTDTPPQTHLLPTGEHAPSAVPVVLSTKPVPERNAAPAAFTIDCDDCEHQRTAVCDDCVVSFIVDRRPGDAVVVDAGEARAVRLLERAGLVPGVRHSVKVG
jgi:hypothetical protein